VFADSTYVKDDVCPQVPYDVRFFGQVKFMKVRKLVLTIAAVAIQVTASASHAAESDARMSDARTLLGLVHFDAQLDETLKQCQTMAQRITPESMYQANPNQFGGITPESRFWPSVVNAFQEFYYTTCSYMDREAFTTAAAESYAKALTKQEMAEAMTFYASPVGKKLADAQIAANAAFQQEAATRLSAAYKVAYDEFAKKLYLLNTTRRDNGGAAKPATTQ
jgi:hypothetical protein